MSKDFFDAKAVEWEDDEKFARSTALVESIKQHIPLQTDWDMVEFGAGTGVVGRQFASLVGRVVLVDPSPEMIRVAEHKCEEEELDNVSPTNADLGGFAALVENFADLTLAVMSFHHMPDLDVAITQLIQVTKPGGYICIIDLHNDQGEFHKHAPEVEVHHVNARTIASQLEQNGLQIVFNEPVYSGVMQDHTENTPYELFMLVAKCEMVE